MPGHALLGCDFSSSPTPKKPIQCCWGELQADRLTVTRLVGSDSLQAWRGELARPGPWVGAFDLPFGLPRELVLALNWPSDWLACMRHYRSMSRAHIRAEFAAFCNARPVGGKFAHRATDGPAGASSSMKWVNPPVAFMMHAGVGVLLDAGLSLPRLHEGDPQRVALEAYPGLLARALIGTRSYKSDDRNKQTPERLIARKDILHALEMGAHPLGPHRLARLRLTDAQRDAVCNDAKGDQLDAVLCLVQAAWGQQRHQEGHEAYGLAACDPLEGWIVGA